MVGCVPCISLIPVAAAFKAYEMEDDLTKDFAEFSLANAIYAALVEAHACQQSARYVSITFTVSITSIIFASPYCLVHSRNAMDNASKNAKDMIASLQMKYNRGRQAAITSELVDIITGMYWHFSFRFLQSSTFLTDLFKGASAM